MEDVFFPWRSLCTGALAGALIAGCAAPSAPPPPPPKTPPACQAASADDPVAGNWLSVRKQQGVVGELRTLFTLNPDGTMAYTEQLKRGKKPSQGLSETGCWKRDGQAVVLQTLLSNGEPVNLDDPIYTNRYTVLKADSQELSLRDADGVSIKARRMSPGYRLPF